MSKNKQATVPSSEAAQAPSQDSLHTRRHLRFGWLGLCAFMSLGLLLEALHGLKVGWYLNVGNESRRLMWTLSHAHGTLLSLVHIATGFSVSLVPRLSRRWRRFASPALMSGGLLLPLGFFLGGLTSYGGDPGLGIFLVPVGAAALLLAVVLTALEMNGLRSP